MKNKIKNLLLILSLSILFTACNNNQLSIIRDDENIDNVENEETEEANDGYDEILTKEVKWNSEIYYGDDDREFLKIFTEIFTKLVKENNEEKVSILEIEYLPTGTCGDDECISMYEVLYKYSSKDSEDTEADNLYVIIDEKYLEDGTTSYDLISYLTKDELMNKYSNSTYLEKYDDMYQAACVEEIK